MLGLICRGIMRIHKKYIFLVTSICFVVWFVCSNLKLPRDFGKTHFIVGASSKKLLKKSQKIHSIEEMLKPGENGIHYTMFAPDDNVLDVLVYLINKEKVSIRMAAFLLTDYKIVKAILEARARGVQIEIVFDAKTVYGKNYKRVKLLKSRGVKIFVYKARKKVKKNISKLMHNKFIIFGDNIYNRTLVWTGSFNFTYSAHMSNQENVVIFDDATSVKKFSDRFDYLKDTLCYAYKR